MSTITATRALRISAIKKVLNKKLLDALKANGGHYTDNHCKDNTLFKATHVGLFNKNGKEDIVLLHDYTTFCINPMDINKDGVPYLSRWSIGGVVYKKDNDTMQDMVNRYNKSSQNSMFGFGTIEEVIAL